MFVVVGDYMPYMKVLAVAYPVFPRIKSIFNVGNSIFVHAKEKLSSLGCF